MAMVCKAGDVAVVRATVATWVVEALVVGTEVVVVSMGVIVRHWQLVFAGSVQSGFLPQKWATVDRNWSRTNPDIEGTEPNHLGPVFCGPW